MSPLSPSLIKTVSYWEGDGRAGEAQLSPFTDEVSGGCGGCCNGLSMTSLRLYIDTGFRVCLSNTVPTKLWLAKPSSRCLHFHGNVYLLHS